MTLIRLKRAYEPAEVDDGFRILVDRLWPRGVSKEELHMDLWAKDIAPSTQLRQWFHEDPENRWEAFEKKYMGELEGSPYTKEFLDVVRHHRVVTLLFGAKDVLHNQAGVLKDYLQKVL